MSAARPTARELAAATPAGRDRYVDFLRAGSIVVVVIGHWLAVTIVVLDGGIQGRHALQVMPATHILTWGFQVIGVFFLVGGYVNAASWSSAGRSGSGYAPWLVARATRLLAPTTVFLAGGAGVAAAARLAGLDPSLVRLGAWLVAIHLWFLVVYLIVVALTPLMLAVHRRWGVRVFLVLVAAAGAGDTARLASGVPWWAAANFVVVWLVAHQLGIAWQDGTLTASGERPWMLLSLGAGGLVVATTLGPYPVSMVAYPGAPLQNTSPPTLALLALVVAHTGLVLVLAPTARRWLERPRIWTAVVAVNGVIMTVFLWHMVPVLVAGLALYPTGIMPGPEVGSAAWFALRPLWLAACGTALMILVAAVGRAERPRVPRPTAVAAGRGSTVLVVTGVVAASAGLAQLTTTGLQGDGPGGVPVAALVTYALGAALLAAQARARGSLVRR